MMQPYGIQRDYEMLNGQGRCRVKACPYPGFEILVWDHWTGNIDRQIICYNHFLIGQFPMSMEYEDADTLLCIPRKFSRRACNATTVRASSQWDHARILQFRRHGFSYRATVAIIADEVSEGRDTHYADAIFNVFTELRRSLIYSMCGEKVMQSLTRPRNETVTCPTCKRMHEEQLAALPPIPPKNHIVTSPKEKPKKLSFEELLDTETLWLNEEAFTNRRNWGERSGRVWKDPASGVQREKRLREFRGGVNRKRG